MPARHLKSRSNTLTVSTTPQVDVGSVVKGVIDEVRQNGDAAVRKYSEKFDKWSPASFKLSQEDIDAAITACPKQTIDDIKEAQKNVRAFAQAQRESLKDFEYEIQPVRPKQFPTGDSVILTFLQGVVLGQKNLPINSVGA